MRDCKAYSGPLPVVCYRYSEASLLGLTSPWAQLTDQ